MEYLRFLIRGSSRFDKIKELKYSDWTCDIDLSKADLNFEPQVRLKEGIKWTADWYRIHKWL
jgi:nucleoside-diphosphate-sugar epimerase